MTNKTRRHSCLARKVPSLALIASLALTIVTPRANAEPDSEMQQLARDYAQVVALLERQDVVHAQAVLECLAKRGHARSQALLSSTLAPSGDLTNAWAWRSVSADADPKESARFLDSVQREMTAEQLIAARARARQMRLKYGPDATGVSCNANRDSEGRVHWNCKRSAGGPVPGSCYTSTVTPADKE